MQNEQFLQQIQLYSTNVFVKNFYPKQIAKGKKEWELILRNTYAKTRGCAQIDSVSQVFCGSTAYKGVSNTEFQAISKFCNSDGDGFVLNQKVIVLIKQKMNLQLKQVVKDQVYEFETHLIESKNLVMQMLLQTQMLNVITLQMIITQQVKEVFHLLKILHNIRQQVQILTGSLREITNQILIILIQLRMCVINYQKGCG